MHSNNHANTDPECPSREELSDFSLGKLPVDQIERIAVHIANCRRCQETLSNLDEETDGVLQEMRLLAQPADIDGTECEHVVAMVEAIGKNPSSGDAGIKTQHGGEKAELGMLRDYKLLELLGAGGMGTVYKALHAKLNTTVAVKVLAETQMNNPAAIHRFEREMMAVGKLRHPNIVQALDAGEEDGKHYLVMEHVDGIDLSALVDRCGPLHVADACELIRQAAVGLQEAHESGLVHRDIKPSNLMLSNDGNVKILDLGLARLQTVEAQGSELTSAGQVMGTPDYMSPEQTKETHAVDIRADIYSLGCTLYKLLVGKPPFSGPEYGTPAERLAGHMRDTAPSVKQLRHDIPDDLAVLIARLLSKDPHDRPDTPDAVAEALMPFTESADLAGLINRAKAAKLLPEMKSRATDDYVSSGLTDTESHADRHLCPSTRRSRRRWFVLVATALMAIIALAGIIIVQTDKGTLEIKVHDDKHVKVMVEQAGERVTIIDTKSRQRIRLHAGHYELKLEDTKSGLSLNTDSFTLRRGDEVVVEVRRIDMPPTNDPNRRAAEWVLGIGGKITIYSPGMSGREISDPGDLPDKPFIVYAADLCKNKMVTNKDLCKLEELKKLQELDLSGTRITDMGINSLKGLPALQQLRLVGTRISNDGLKILSTLSTLENLSIGFTAITDDGLIHLASLSHLKCLYLNGTQVTSAGMEHLWALGQLRRIDLRDTRVDDTGIERLKPLKKLESIWLSASVTDKGLAHLVEFQDLHSIDAYSAHITDKGLQYLAKIKGLSSLILTKTQVTAKGVEKLHKEIQQCRIDVNPAIQAELDQMRSIESNKPGIDPSRRVAEWILKIGGKVTVVAKGEVKKEIIHLLDLPKHTFQIVAIDLQKVEGVDDKDLQKLVGLKHLENLALRYTNITDRAMPHISALSTLQSLTLSGTEITDNSLPLLSKLTKLKTLQLACKGVSDDGLHHIGNLQGLLQLALGESSRVTSKGLAKLKGLTKLRSLHVCNAKVDDTGLKTLAMLTDLEILRLQNTQITNAGLHYLLTLKKLQELDLDNTQITDAGLDTLGRITQLKRLELSGTRVTPIGIATLKTVIPDCEIVYNQIGTVVNKAIPLCFKRENISSYELKVAGGGDPAKAPSKLVAILGDSRLKHWNSVDLLRFSPNNKMLASASWDGTVRCWSVTNGSEHWCIRSRPRCMAFSPDGKIIACACGKEGVCLVHSETGEQIVSLKHQSLSANCVAFAPDGKTLFSGEQDGSITQWDSETRQPKWTVRTNNADVLAIDIDPKGKMGASGDKKGNVKLWSTTACKELFSFQAHTDPVASIAFGSDGKTISTASRGGTVKLWDIDSGKQLQSFSSEPKIGLVGSIRISRDGKLAMLGYSGGTFELWNIATRKILHSFHEHTNWGKSADISHDGSMLATADQCGSIRLWDTKTWKQQLERPAHTSMVRHISVSPNGSTLASASWDRSVRLWDLSNGRNKRTLLRPWALDFAVFSPDGNTLATSLAFNDKVELWDRASLQLVHTIAGHSNNVAAAAFSPCGKNLATASWDHTVKLWDTGTGKEKHTLKGHGDKVLSVAFSADGTRIASASVDATVKVCDASTLKEIYSRKLCEGDLYKMAFNPNGDILAAIVDRKLIKLSWAANSQQQVLAEDKRPLSVVFSHDGAKLCNSNDDGTIQIWNSKSGELEMTLHIGPPHGIIEHVTFTPDGRHLLTANGNGTIYVFRLKSLTETQSQASGDADRPGTK